MPHSTDQAWGDAPGYGGVWPSATFGRRWLGIAAGQKELPNTDYLFAAYPRNQLVALRTFSLGLLCALAPLREAPPDGVHVKAQNSGEVNLAKRHGPHPYCKRSKSSQQWKISEQEGTDVTEESQRGKPKCMALPSSEVSFVPSISSCSSSVNWLPPSGRAGPSALRSRSAMLRSRSAVLDKTPSAKSALSVVALSAWPTCPAAASRPLRTAEQPGAGAPLCGNSYRSRPASAAGHSGGKSQYSWPSGTSNWPRARVVYRCI
jgi:hypothetical protein